MRPVLVAIGAARGLAELENLRAAQQPPEGVVFEIMTRQPRSGDRAAPRLQYWLHQSVRLGAEGLGFHLCGECAAGKRRLQKDLADFVDIAAGGSAQLAACLESGFVHIRMEPPHAAD